MQHIGGDELSDDLISLGASSAQDIVCLEDGRSGECSGHRSWLRSGGSDTDDGMSVVDRELTHADADQSEGA